MEWYNKNHPDLMPIKLLSYFEHDFLIKSVHNSLVMVPCQKPDNYLFVKNVDKINLVQGLT